MVSQEPYQSGSISVIIRILYIYQFNCHGERRAYLLGLLRFLHFVKNHPTRPWLSSKQNRCWMDVQDLRKKPLLDMIIGYSSHKLCSLSRTYTFRLQPTLHHCANIPQLNSVLIDVHPPHSFLLGGESAACTSWAVLGWILLLTLPEKTMHETCTIPKTVHIEWRHYRLWHKDKLLPEMLKRGDTYHSREWCDPTDR